MTAPPAPSTHHLLLALAGRVDDDLLATARELVAIGEEPQALEILVATLVADRTALPALLRSEVVELARRRAIELDADGLLAPAAGSLDGTRHVFGAGPAGADERLAELLTSPPPGSTMRVTWRMTPAGAAPGPVPHPVVLVELSGPGIAPEVVSYRLGAHLLRSGLPASVEAYTPADALPAYQRAALERAWQVGAPGAGHGGLPTGARGTAHGPVPFGGVAGAGAAGSGAHSGAAGPAAGNERAIRHGAPVGSPAAAGPGTSGVVGGSPGGPAASGGGAAAAAGPGASGLLGAMDGGTAEAGPGRSGFLGAPDGGPAEAAPAAGPAASGFLAAADGGTAGAASAAGAGASVFGASGTGVSGSGEAASGGAGVGGVAEVGPPAAPGASAFTAPGGREPGVGTTSETSEPSGGAAETTFGAAVPRDSAGTAASSDARAARNAGPAADRAEEAANRPGESRSAHGAAEQGPRPSPSPRPAPADPGTPPPSPRPVLGRPLTSSQPPAAFQPLRPRPDTPEGAPFADGPVRPDSGGPATDRPAPRAVPGPGPRPGPDGPRLGPIEITGPQDEPRTSPFERTRAPRSRPTLSVVPPAPGYEPPSGPRQAPVTRPTPIVRTEDSLPTPAEPWPVSRDETEQTDPPVLASMRDPLSGPLREPLLDAQLDRAETGPVPIVGLTPPQGTPAVDEAAPSDEATDSTAADSAPADSAPADSAPADFTPADEPSDPSAPAPGTGRRRRVEAREPAPEWTRDWASGEWAMPTTGRRRAADLPAAGEGSGSLPESPTSAQDTTDPAGRDGSADLRGASEGADLLTPAGASSPVPDTSTADRTVDGDTVEPGDRPGPSGRDAEPSDVADRGTDAYARTDGEVQVDRRFADESPDLLEAPTSDRFPGPQPPEKAGDAAPFAGPTDPGGGRRRRPDPGGDEPGVSPDVVDSAAGRRHRAEPDLTIADTGTSSDSADFAGGGRRAEPDLTAGETGTSSDSADPVGGRRRRVEHGGDAEELVERPSAAGPGIGPADSPDPTGLARDPHAAGSAGASELPDALGGVSDPRANGSAGPFGGSRGFDLLGRSNGTAGTGGREAGSAGEPTDLHLDEPAESATDGGSLGDPTDRAGSSGPLLGRPDGTTRGAEGPDDRDGLVDAATAKLGAVRPGESLAEGPVPSDPRAPGSTRRGADGRTEPDRPTGTPDPSGPASEAGDGRESGRDRDLPGIPLGDTPAPTPFDALPDPAGEEGTSGSVLEGGLRRSRPGDASHQGDGTPATEPGEDTPGPSGPTSGSYRRTGISRSEPGEDTPGSPSATDTAGPRSDGDPALDPTGATPAPVAPGGRPATDPSNTEDPAHRADTEVDDAPTGRRAARDGVPTIRPVPGGRRRARHRPDDAEPDPWNFATAAGDVTPEPTSRPEEGPQDRSDGLPPPRPVPRTIPRIRRGSDTAVSGLFGPGEVPPSRPDDPFGTGPGPSRGRSGEPHDGPTASTEPAEPDTTSAGYSAFSSREQDLLRLLQQELEVRESPPERRNGSGPYGPPDLAG
ncbi:hypothetical protein LWC33_29630 [Pseudonocardia sp. RS11V-5]|uniref:hypothetical protein n=1 Tax=Pseudonocardia terrae TaxID=2905831 RepID=UPI001E2FA72A|nr:hypothetical protein [Pseudonocardia terrae]MCE3555592.1 hypothetical protein [Pseudonocardia terrae]